MVAGLQVPVMPLLDMAGRAGTAALTHSGPIAVNTGVICTAMVISKAVTTAHCPAAGVKLYVVVPTADVVIVAGFHVPLIPLVDINGNAGAAALRQSEPNGLKMGVISGVTVTSNVVAAAHCPASGVKV